MTVCYVIILHDDRSFEIFVMSTIYVSTFVSVDISTHHRHKKNNIMFLLSLCIRIQRNSTARIQYLKKKEEKKGLFMCAQKTSAK